LHRTLVFVREQQSAHSREKSAARPLEGQWSATDHGQGFIETRHAGGKTPAKNVVLREADDGEYLFVVRRFAGGERQSLLQKMFCHVGLAACEHQLAEVFVDWPELRTVGSSFQQLQRFT
jgi:hypothetical protein